MIVEKTNCCPSVARAAPATPWRFSEGSLKVLWGSLMDFVCGSQICFQIRENMMIRGWWLMFHDSRFTVYDSWMIYFMIINHQSLTVDRRSSTVGRQSPTNGHFHWPSAVHHRQSMVKNMKIVWAVLQISSLLGFGHARAAFGQTPFSRVWYIVVTW